VRTSIRTLEANRVLLRALLGAMLAIAGLGSHAAEEPSQISGSGSSGAASIPAASSPPAARTPRRHYSAGEIIDANVHRLAHGLELDPGQRNKLRGILADHYEALTKLRTDAPPGTDRSGAMRAIVDRTRERIRSILNETQKQKYSTDVSPELAGPSRADLEHWLEVRDAAATQAPGPPAKEN
jgi:hypothetical protein